MTALTYTAACSACEWAHDGDDANTQAERHVKATGHATETRGTPK